MRTIPLTLPDDPPYDDTKIRLLDKRELQSKPLRLTPNILVLSNSKTTWSTIVTSSLCSPKFTLLVRQAGTSGLTPNFHNVSLHPYTLGETLGESIAHKPTHRRFTREIAFLTRKEMLQEITRILNEIEVYE